MHCTIHHFISLTMEENDNNVSRFITLANGRKIGHGFPTFIIAEIGQNHQGDIDTAKELIRLAKDCGADCVKFQKTDLKSKFTMRKFNEPYDSINSFGQTYGDHKSKLEFSHDQFRVLQLFAEDLGILFTASAMDETSLHFLASINVPFIKIGSGDTNNFPMIEKASNIMIPVVLSTGMSNIETVAKAHDILQHGHPADRCPASGNGHSSECIKNRRSQFAILHCVSSYPTPLGEINLNVIKTYRELFPRTVIGYSGHEAGIEVSTAAVTELNCSIIERHLTLDQTMRGTDHKCSLTGPLFKSLVDRIRAFEATGYKATIDHNAVYFGSKKKERQRSEMACWNKLGKSIVSNRVLSVGHKITRTDVSVKVSIEPKGIPGEMFYDLLGKTVVDTISADEAIQFNQVDMSSGEK